MHNEPRKIEYSIFYTVRSRHGGGIPINKRTVSKQFALFFFYRSIFAGLCRFHRVASRCVARPGLLAEPVQDTLQSYVTLARLALTSTSIEYLRSHGDRAHE